jgi:hypothetical protein
MEDTVQRLVLPPFGSYAATILSYMLVRPEVLGLKIALVDRREIYNRIHNEPEGDRLLVQIYDAVAPALRAMCRQRGLSFELAFPPPAGLEAHRRWMRERFAPAR